MEISSPVVSGMPLFQQRRQDASGRAVVLTLEINLYNMYVLILDFVFVGMFSTLLFLKVFITLKLAETQGDRDIFPGALDH